MLINVITFNFYRMFVASNENPERTSVEVICAGTKCAFEFCAYKLQGIGHSILTCQCIKLCIFQEGQEH